METSNVNVIYDVNEAPIKMVDKFLIIYKVKSNFKIFIMRTIVSG